MYISAGSDFFKVFIAKKCKKLCFLNLRRLFQNFCIREWIRRGRGRELSGVRSIVN